MKNTKLAAEKIHAEYAPKEEKEMAIDKLRALDAEVKRPAKLFAYTFGTIGSLVMGTGMCLAMDVLGKRNKAPGLIFGITGMAMMGGNYHLYQKMLAERKAQYADEILELSESIISEEGKEETENSI